MTPSGGSAQNISVKGLGSAAYTASTAYATSGHNHDSAYLGKSATAAKATILATTRSIWGRSFNGNGDVSGGINYASSLAFNGMGTSSNHGGYIDFYYNAASTRSARIICEATDTMCLRVKILGLGSGESGSAVHPTADNKTQLGTASNRWTTVYAKSSSINTSDERLKQDIEEIPDEVLEAWSNVNFIQYRFIDSYEEKNEAARIHTGCIAQDIDKVFKDANLSADRYGLFCYDEWNAEEEIKDENGEVLKPAREAGNAYSLRYEEALCMEAACNRKRVKKLEDRIARLEKLLNVA